MLGMTFILFASCVLLWGECRRARRLRFLPSSVHRRLFPRFHQLWRWQRHALFFAAFALLAAWFWPETPRLESADDEEPVAPAIVFLVDMSASMLARDVDGSRLQRVLQWVHSATGILARGELALVQFAGTAYTFCPPTRDAGLFRQFLDQLENPAAALPVPGTNIELALREAARLLSNRRQGRRLVVLLSDGEAGEGEAEAPARQLAAEGVELLVVGIGDPDAATVIHLAGEQLLTNPRTGTPVRTSLAETDLRNLASASGGTYLRDSGTGPPRQAARRALASLGSAWKPSPVQARSLDAGLFPLALLGAICALLARLALPGSSRRLPLWLLASAVAGPGAGAHADAAGKASPGSSALAQIVPSVPLLKESIRIRYRRGDVLLKKGDLESASRLFADLLGEARTPPDVRIRATLNSGIAAHLQGLRLVDRNAPQALARLRRAGAFYREAQRLDPALEEASANLRVLQRDLLGFALHVEGDRSGTKQLPQSQTRKTSGVGQPASPSAEAEPRPPQGSAGGRGRKEPLAASPETGTRPEHTPPTQTLERAFPVTRREAVEWVRSREIPPLLLPRRSVPSRKNRHVARPW